MKRIATFQKGIALAALAMASLSSCEITGALKSLPIVEGFSKADDATLSVLKKGLGSTGKVGLDVFKANVMAVMAEARCTSCHASQVPIITASDVNVAYTTSKERMNFNKVTDGMLYVKARNIPHCAPTCVDIGNQKWISALESWATAEKSSGDGGGGGTIDPIFDEGVVYQTTAIQLTGASGARTIPLMVPGAQLTNVSLSFTLEDPVSNDPASARISDLKLVNNSGRAVYVENIRIFQGTSATLSIANLSPGAGMTYGDVSKIVATGSNPILSQALALLSKTDGAYVVFAFGALEPSNFSGCSQQALFDSTVAPVLTNCTSCHNANGTARNAWIMATGSAALCAQALQRSNLNTPIFSTIIQYPFAGQNGHSIRMNATQKDAVVNWITAE